MPSSKSSEPRARRAGLFERLRSFFRKPVATPSGPHQVLGKAGTRRRKGVPDAHRMIKALKGVLDRHAASRSVLAHLSVVEQALEHGGLPALEDVPAEVLGRALSQLEMLVSDWSEAGIAALRAQIKAAMAKPGRFDVPRGAPPAKKQNDFDNSRMQVNEASVSVFLDAQARWETSATGGR
jgi:hypothetical protein